MEAEKIINLLLLELTSDKTKAEIELERLINKEQNIDQTLHDMKFQLKNLATIELSISKLASMSDNNNNNNNNEEQILTEND